MAKANAARQQAFRDRREARGLERHEIYCYAEDWPFIFQQVQRIAARTHTKKFADLPPRVNSSVNEVAHRANVSVRMVWKQIAEGKLTVCKIGDRTLVPEDAFQAWIAKGVAKSKK